MKQRNLLWVSIVTILTLLLGACSPAAPVTVVVTAPPVIQTVQVTVQGQATQAPAATEAPPATPATSFAGLQDPKAVALAAAGGQKLGGTLDILAVWAGSELDSFKAVVAPFQDATGVNVEFESTRDFAAVLTTRVNGGNPPDIAGAPSAALAASWAGEGKVVDLTSVVDMAQMKKDYAQSWIDLGTVNGKLVQVYAWSALKGLIWYDPKTYDGPLPPKTWDDLQAWAKKKADAGTTPWCVGLESGAASGWPATDWIQDFVLHQSGPDVYNKWWAGTQAWTSPEIKMAWQAFGAVAADPKMVNGGPNSELTLNFGNGGDQMFKTPPGCFLHHQATFMTDFFVKNTPGIKPVADFNFFAFPDINPQYSGIPEVAGDSLSMYKDTPQARAFIKYLTSPEAQAIWVARGGKLATNKRVPLDAYPDPLAKNAGQIIASAKGVVFGAGDQMPDAMVSAFWKACLDYVQNPGNLDSILSNLDSVQKDAYKKS